jgi:CheY-like chemotaxis protein
MAHAQTLDFPGVLVVDDEPIIRLNSSDIISDAGFRPYEANGAEQAIALLEQHSDILAVLTDINMPGSMDGLELARYVHDRWPPIKVIVTSGRVKPRAEEMPCGSRFVAKPCRPSQLVRELHEMIGNASAY